jgi:drug/metabolite transporter (DMT)-like permease
VQWQTRGADHDAIDAGNREFEAAVERDGRTTSALATQLWLANLTFDIVGHLSFRAASLQAGKAEGLRYWRAMASRGFLWLGVAAFVCELLMWIGFLTLVPLSQGVMVASANTIGVLIGGRILFGETVTPMRLGAISAIAFGVALVGWGGA